MENLIKILVEGGYSCVVQNGSEVRTFSKRGVSDLFALYKSDPEFLRGAFVADKIVGKAAATIMIAGGAKKLYAKIISQRALNILEDKDIGVAYDRVVPVVINRDKTDSCPMEKLCHHETSIDKLLEIIEDFQSKQEQ